MLDQYFISNNVEIKLDNILHQHLYELDKEIIEVRFNAEKYNIIIHLLPYMKKLNFKISYEIIDVITNKYSSFFFPELTHLTIYQYNEFFLKFYDILNNIISKGDNINILDIGCGVSCLHIYLLNNSKNLAYYEGIDKNSLIIELLKNCKTYKCGFRYCTVQNFDFFMNYDYIFMFNILKYLNYEDAIKLIKQIITKNTNATIIISDNDLTINNLLHILNKEQFKFYFDEQFLIIEDFG